MAKKDSKSNPLGALGALLVLAVLICAIILPFYLLIAYIHAEYQVWKLLRTHRRERSGDWLTENEQREYLEAYARDERRLERNQRAHQELTALIAEQHQRAEHQGIATNQDGSYSRRSYAGQDIRRKIEEAESHLENLKLSPADAECRQPRFFWNELNDEMIWRNKMFLACLGWLLGASYFFAYIRAGGLFGVWLDLLVPACTAGVGYLLAKWFSRNPAASSLAKPAYVDIGNVNAPKYEIHRRPRVFLRFAGMAIWTAGFAFAIMKGGDAGSVAGAILAEEKQAKLEYEQEMEQERVMKEKNANLDFYAVERTKKTAAEISPAALAPEIGEAEPGEPAPAPRAEIAPKAEPVVIRALPVEEPAVSSRMDAHAPMDPQEVRGWDLARIRTEINLIYARHGFDFPNPEVRQWAATLPGYQPIPGMTEQEIESRFSEQERADILLMAEARKNLRQPPSAAAAGRALPVSDPLDAADLATWDATRVRNEIHAIYARHGVDFPPGELRAWAEKQPGYAPVAGRSFADAEALFDPVARRNIELLAARRAALKAGERR